MDKKQLVDGRALARFHSALVGSKNRGDKVRTTLEHAEQLASIGVLQILGAAAQKPAGPSEQKPAGPQEQKGGAAIKKSSGAPTAGRMIALRSLSALGRIIASSSLAAGRALLMATASRGSTLRERIAMAVRSRSLR